MEFRKQNGKFKNKKSFQIIMAMILLSFLGMFIFFTVYFNRVYDLMLEKDMEQIEWTSHFVTKLIHEEIQHTMENLHASEDFFCDYEEYEQKKVVNALKDLQNRLGFEEAGLTDLEGNTINNEGDTSIMENPLFIQNMENNKSYISNIMELSDRMLLAVPVHKDGKVVGGIWGIYAVSTIAQEIELTDSLHRYFQIVDDNGEYISKSGNVYAFAENMNLWDEIKRYDFSDGVTVEMIKKNVEEGKKGYFHFTYQGKGRYVTYEPLGINNWYVFSVLVEDFLGDYVKEVEKIFNSLLVCLGICIVIVLGTIGTFIYRTMKTIKEQNENLLVKNSLLSMILKKTRDIPFEVNTQERKVYLYHSNRNKEEIDHEIIEDISPENLRKEGLIKEAGYEEYKVFYEKMMAKEEMEPIILEMKIDATWTWIRLHAFSVNEYHVVGFLEDYNEQIDHNKKMSEMKKKNQTDALTQLYNRDYFTRKVGNILKEKRKDDTQKALFLLDLDYFKEVNDTLGHIAGDEVLQETGRRLRSITRNTDLVARLGGDEFVVFIQNVSNLEAVCKCAGKINEALIMRCGEGDHRITVTASIGIAVVDGETTFKELYERADKALYQVKKKGRNGYQIEGGEIFCPGP